jgi:thymidylate synthase (FAD)
MIRCELVQVSADDLFVVNAARVSLNQESSEFGDREKGLINFLMRNHHGTPFEHNMFTFRVEVPMFVQREQMRHRIGHSYNEWSARYSKMDPKFYIPDYVRTQEGKPGAYSFEALDEEKAEEFRRDCYGEYEYALDNGVAKEQARYYLPSCTYTKYYWTCNARSLMHFIGLRNHPAAMWEISQVAKIAENCLSIHMPETHARYIEHGRKAP